MTPLIFYEKRTHISHVCVCVCARSVRPFRGPRGVCGVYVILLLFQPARARKFFAIHTHMCMRVCVCVLCESNNKCSISRIYGLNLLVRRCYTENDSDTRMHMFFFCNARTQRELDASLRRCDIGITYMNMRTGLLVSSVSEWNNGLVVNLPAEWDLRNC